MGFVRLAAGAFVGWLCAGLVARRLHTWLSWGGAQLALALITVLLLKSGRARDVAVGWTIGWLSLTIASLVFAAG